MGWAGFLRKTRPNYVSPMGRVIEVTTRPWVTHGPGWAGLWAGLMRPIYNIMNNAANREGEFIGLSEDIAIAVQSSLVLYQKYYNFIDGLDVYYIALILNPRYKTRLLEQELGLDAAKLIIEHIKEVLNL